MSKQVAKTVKKKPEAAEKKSAASPAVPKDRFLLPDNTAVSPLDEFPGTIELPSIFSMTMHQEYTDLAKDKEIQKPFILSVEGQDDFLVFNRMHYDIVVKFGRIRIENKAEMREDEEKKPFDFTDFDSIPTVVSAFIGIVGLEYLRRHTQFPGFRGTNVEVLQTGKTKNGAAVGI